MFRYNHSCVSVGLARREQMIAGFVYNPYVDEMFTAVREKEVLKRQEAGDPEPVCDRGNRRFRLRPL